jgi:D-alanyl-lipoteichoic acid acyltransferase DltB (MBOAT superfamily)
MALRDHGQAGLAAAVFINMVTIGIWHGFTGPYLAFGVFHGVALTASVLTLRRRDAFFKSHIGLARIRRIAAPLVTFHLVVLGLIVFRSDSLSSAAHYLSGLLGGFFQTGIPPLRFALADMPLKLLLGLGALVIFMEAVHIAMRHPAWRERFTTSPRILRWATYYGAIAVTLAFSRLGEQGFIYGRF